MDQKRTIHGHDHFDYDLLEASKHGKITERIFHKDRVKMWLKAADYRNKKILDIGCNTGILLIPFAKRHYNIIGIDNNPNDIKKAKENLIKEALSPNLVRVCDARSLPFKDSSFDIILLSDVLEHTSDPKKVASEALRVLKKNGLVLATVPYFLHPVVKYPWLRKLLSGRRNIDEYPDVPFTFENLKKFFPQTIVRRKKLVYFWSSIFGAFQKV